MQVIDRSGNYQPLDIGRVQSRIMELTGELSCDPGKVIVATCGKIKDGMTTRQIDEISAEASNDLLFENIDYGKLAARIYIDSYMKTLKNLVVARLRPRGYSGGSTYKMRDVYEVLYNHISHRGIQAPLIHPVLMHILNKYADKIENMIDYKREFNYSYNSYRVLVEQFLIKLQIPRGLSELVQHMYMRIALMLHIAPEFDCNTNRLDKTILIKTAESILLKYFDSETFYLEIIPGIESGKYDLEDILFLIRSKNDMNNSAIRDAEKLEKLIVSQTRGWNELTFPDDIAIPELLWERVRDTYNMMSTLEFTHATPTMTNLGTLTPQCSSCYLLGPPFDSLRGMIDMWTKISTYSKYSGGIGASNYTIRSVNAPVGNYGQRSNGTLAYLQINDTMIGVVRQSKRAGVCAEYLRPWHPEFMSMVYSRLPNAPASNKLEALYTACWWNDEFLVTVIREYFRRRELGIPLHGITPEGTPGVTHDVKYWYLVDPTKSGNLSFMNNKSRFRNSKEILEFEIEVTEKFSGNRIAAYESRGMAASAEYHRIVEKYGGTPVSAYEMWWNVCAVVSKSSLPYNMFDDNVNRLNITGVRVPLSNLCTEIVEPSNPLETAVCNLASICIDEFVSDTPTPGDYELYHPEMSRGYGRESPTKYIDYVKLARCVRMMTINLDKIIDINYYPTDHARRSNLAFRPIGIGMHALQDLYYKLFLPYGSRDANRVLFFISQFIYYIALRTSCELARSYGAYPNFNKSLYPGAKSDHGKSVDTGKFHWELWLDQGSELMFPELLMQEHWENLRIEIMKHGVRNSQLIAIAPTGTSSDRVGKTHSCEARGAHLNKRKNNAGEQLVITESLFQLLRTLGPGYEILNLQDSMLHDKYSGISSIMRIPGDIREVYRTAFEISLEEQRSNYLAMAPFIDQARSFNIFVRDPDVADISDHLIAMWFAGAKNGTYYTHRLALSDASKLQTDRSNLEECKGCVV